MTKALDVTGQRYGRIVGVCYVGRNKFTHRVWRWKCDCGVVFDAVLQHVRYGDTTSCGCYKKERSVQAGLASRMKHGEASFNCLYQSYRTRAKKNGNTFSIEKDLFGRLTKLDCHYCGLPPSQVRKANKWVFGDYVYSGLDRVDNSRGYEPDNVVPCCSMCNRAKGVMTREEFLAWVSRVAAFQAGGRTNTETSR